MPFGTWNDLLDDGVLSQKSMLAQWLSNRDFKHQRATNHKAWGDQKLGRTPTPVGGRTAGGVSRRKDAILAAQEAFETRVEAGEVASAQPVSGGSIHGGSPSDGNGLGIPGVSIGGVSAAPAVAAVVRQESAVMRQPEIRPTMASAEMRPISAGASGQDAGDDGLDGLGVPQAVMLPDLIERDVPMMSRAEAEYHAKVEAERIRREGPEGMDKLAGGREWLTDTTGVALAPYRCPGQRMPR